MRQQILGRLYQLDVMWCRELIVLSYFWFLNISSYGIALQAFTTVIEHCPGSNVPSIRSQTQYHEISGIFYYTSWDEESVKSLKVYNDVAYYYSSYVYFAAVNCWHLACNCTHTHITNIGSGSPDKWPTLIIHYGLNGKKQLQYNGAWNFSALCQFLNNVLKPLERVYSADELREIRLQADVVILGLFKKSSCHEYKQYTAAAFKWLETDPLRSYRFVVTFGNISLPEFFNIKEKKVPRLEYLTMTKSIKSFNGDGELMWNVSNIVLWLHDEFNGVHSTLHGHSTPISLAVKLKQGPVVGIFANNLHFYEYMEEVLHASKMWSTPFNLCNLLTIQDLEDNINVGKTIKEFMNISNVEDASTCCYGQMKLDHLKHYYKNNILLTRLFQYVANPFLEVNNDLKSVHYLRNFYRQTKCLKTNIHHSIPLRIAIAQYLDKSIKGLQHRNKCNRTVSIVVVDNNEHANYLNFLGIPISNHNLATTFIADNEKESIYVMTETFGIHNFMKFLQNFFENNLSALQRNADVYPEKSTSKPDSFQLQEVNRFMFLNQLHYHNITTVVLIYSPSCPLCANLQNTFLQLAAVLRHQSNTIRFLRLNSQSNDLPWQFVMTTLPTLIVFPREHYANSRIFPSFLKTNFRNVLSFILAQLSAVDQVKLVLSICEGDALPQSKASCWQFVKKLITKHIAQHLHYWQLFETERNLIFERLSAFKDMSLDIQRNSRLL
uniref:Thioredoxin domain-containing protein n=1 Tax=Glossina brevipalpis TaxID=37001 RepID=A0A1A9W755_9MUSC